MRTFLIIDDFGTTGTATHKLPSQEVIRVQAANAIEAVQHALPQGHPFTLLDRGTNDPAVVRVEGTEARGNMPLLVTVVEIG